MTDNKLDAFFPATAAVEAAPEPLGAAPGAATATATGGGGGGAGGPAAAGPGDEGDFYQRVANIKSGMSDVRREVETLAKSQEEERYAALPARIQQLEKDITEISGHVTGSIASIKNQLQAIRDENEKLSDSSAEKRIRRNMHDILLRKFMELIEDFNKQQIHHKENMTQRIDRHLQTLGHMTPEQAEKVAESYDLPLTEVVQCTSYDGLLHHIQERHEDIVRLETSIRELYQMFNEFAVLVGGQQELLDNIEQNVGKAADYVVKGNEAMAQARHDQKVTRKCMIWLFVIIVIVFVVVLFVLLGALGVFSHA